MTTQAFPKPVRLILENYKIPSWNSMYSGQHFSKRMAMKDEACFAVIEALNNQSFTMYRNKVHITIVGHFRRLLDCDNIASKLVIDALKGKLIEDDTPKYVDGVTTRSVKSTSDFVEVIIEEMVK